MLVYAGILIGIATRMSRRQKTTSEYFVANRRIPGWVVSFTLVGTMISSMTVIAHPGAVFARNMWNAMGIVAMPFVLVLVAWYIVPFYRRVVGMSAYEYLAKRFGNGARVYSSAGFLLGRIVDIGFTLYTTSIATAIITGWDIRYVVVIVGMIIVLYTMVGGIEGVVWIDVVQGVVLLSAAIAIIGTVLFVPRRARLGCCPRPGRTANFNWATSITVGPVFSRTCRQRGCCCSWGSSARRPAM